jgi:hypothetical protein
LVGQGEGMGERGLFVGHPEQVLVWDHQQGDAGSRSSVR